MMINERTPQISPDICRACCDSFNFDKKNKHNLLQCRPGGPSSREKPDYTQALEAITGVQVTPSDGFQKAVCTRCRSMLSKYHKNVYEMGRITAFIRERAVGLSDTMASPFITSPMRGTTDAACQTESSGGPHIATNRNPSRRSKALQVRVPDHSVYCSTDDLEVVGSKPVKRRRNYDTESSDGSPPHLPLPDDVTDWHANSESLWSGSELRITDSPSSQADSGAWVKVTVKDEGKEEDIPWAGGRQEENEEQEDRKPPVSSAAGPLSDASALSETPSPCPGRLGHGKKDVKEEETETTAKDEETLVAGGTLAPPNGRCGNRM